MCHVPLVPIAFRVLLRSSTVYSAQVGVKSQELAAEEIDAWSGAIAVLLGGAPTEAGQVEVGGLSPIERLEAAFRAADKDGSGGLNTGELLELLLALGVRMSPTQAGILKEGFDVNSDGVISLDEFKQVLWLVLGVARV